MATTSLAIVQLGPHELEPREFPLPSIGDDDGLMRVERCGICGSDVEQLNGDLTWVPYPVIPGHEPLGVIEEIGPEASRRWGVRAGDRVIVEAPVPCRYCIYCAQGLYNSCTDRLNLGYTSIKTEPALFGGYSEYLYLHPNATLHRISRSLSPDLAVLYNPLACGVSWATEVGGTKLGDTVVVLGGGQRGIACGIAAKAAGAEKVAITGLTADAHKLTVARELGIDATIDVQQEDLRARIHELTDGHGADVVIDVVPNVAETFVDAVDIVRPRGMVVVAGMKGDVAVQGLMTDKIALKALTIRGAHGKQSSSYELAIGILESYRFPLDKLASRVYPLTRASHAIDVLAGRVPDETAICVSLAPGA